MRITIGAFTLALGALLLGAAATAQIAEPARYPNRPIRLVVPLPPGGTSDILARIVGEELGKRLGVPIVIENRPGANTGIGAQLAARSAADGYTLLSASDTTMVMNPATGVAMSYDPFKDFAAISMLAYNSQLLVVRADGPKTVEELVKKGRASRQKLNYAAGIAVNQIAGERLATLSGFDVVLIPYKGSSEVIQGLLSGSVDFIVDGIASVLPLVRSGQLRALAKLDSRPLTPLPDLPVLATAANLPQFGEMATWIGLVAPVDTPASIIGQLNAEIRRAYADPAVVQKLDAVGIDAVSSTPAEFDAFFRAEAVRWKALALESSMLFK
jgi:tripartite-type tricarboxylate transporter receptor subunit TctC